MSEYKYPADDVFHQEEIKKSTFIVHIGHTPDLNSAKAFIKNIEEKYSDARHNCWAHVAGNPGGSHVYGFSDDGEPNGTAGKPMLNVLVGSGLGEVTAACLIHTDKPLRRSAEDNGRFMAPAVWIAVSDRFGK